MGDPLGSFLKERASEDKARWKDSCWSIGTVGQIWDVTLLLVFRKLGLGEVKPTTISLQMADRSLTYLRGVIGDALVKVDKFIFSVDFVVLDMEEDQEIPLILGRPFLAMVRALIEVYNGNLTLSVNDEEVKFNIFHTMRFPNEAQHCNRISVVDECVKWVIDES